MKDQLKKVVSTLRNIFKEVQSLTADENLEADSPVWNVEQATTNALKEVMLVNEISGTQYDEAIEEYVSESLHQLGVGEIVGEEFEDILNIVDVEVLMKRLLNDFCVFLTER